MADDAPSGWLPPGYQPLLEAATAVFKADQRIRAAWVHGSVARGDADAVSDLDVIVAVGDFDIPEFAGGWRERLQAITPTVMARPSFGQGGSWLSITAEGLRFDLWVEPAGRVARSAVTDRTLLFDRDGLDALVPTSPDPPKTSDTKLAELGAWVADCVALYRSAGRRTAASGFGAEAETNWTAGGLVRLECAHTLRWILYSAMVEVNRPLPVTGLKQWSAKLTTDQRRLFEGLPTDDPDPLLAALEDLLGPLASSDRSPAPSRLAAFPEGYIRGLQLTDLPPPGRLRPLAEEVLALHLYLAVVVHRQDWLLGLEGVYSLRRLLYELFLEVNGRPPVRSARSWDDRLTAAQRDELLGLPTGTATRAGVIQAHQEVKAAFARHARSLLRDDYPTALEHAVDSYVARHLRQAST
ncbi:MAG: hypothetical protein ACRD0Z_04680 [Acidimicrobiales bacterium]